MPEPKITATETKGARAAIDRMTKSLVDNGQDHKRARQIAREQAIKADRRNNR